jgi:hypothetical protein
MKKIQSPMWVGVIQSTEKEKAEANFLFLLELGIPSFSVLGHQGFRSSGLTTLRLTSVTFILTSSHPYSFELELNYTTGFSGYPACSWHISPFIIM